MKTTTIKEINKKTEEFMNQDLEIKGWVRTVRSSKDFGFIEINDGSFFKGIQIVMDSGLSGFDELVKTPIGSALRIEGKLIESQGSGQAFEIKASKIEVLGEADADFPLQKKRHSFEFLRTIAHIRPRSNTFSAVFRVRSVLDFAIHSFFQEQGFVYVHTPIITSNDCEGAGEMFQVTNFNLKHVPMDEKGEIDQKRDFFGRKAGLTVSGQLNAETFAMALRNVYTFGPTFRAENSNTTRHAAEFWMVEPEMAFAELSNDMDLAERMIKYVIKFVRERCPEEMEFFNKMIDPTLFDRLDTIVNNDFGRITYTEAVEQLKKSGQKFNFPVEWGIDLQTEHERFLVEQIYKKPVFVTGYPKDIKAFYMRLNDDGKTVAAMDLLAPGVGEIIGGSQREERLELLDKRMKEMEINSEDLYWYRDLRRFGGVKHAGFGLGFERLIMYLTGMENIRDVIPFPRTPKSIDF